MKDEEAKTLIASAVYRCYCGATANRLIEVINRVFEANAIKTNADRIRSMTDEELADFLDRWELGDIDYSKTFCDMCKGQYDCHDDCLMEWLKQDNKTRCRCGGRLSEVRYHNGRPYRHCFDCHREYYEEGDNS